jgi:Tfp pilus assembly protein PilN
VAVERGHVTWAAERTLEGVGELAAALAELAAERPRGYGRARVVVSGDLVQVRLLDGLPRLAAARLHRVVSLQAMRWFLKNGGPPTIAAARQRGGASAVAVAAGSDALDAVAQGLAAAGLRLEAAGAAAATCAAILPDGEHVLAADGVAMHLVVDHSQLRALRRSAASAADEGVGPAVPGLNDSSRFFPAYAAAVIRPAPPLADGRSDGERLVRRQQLAVRLLLAALLLWGTAAGVLATRVQGAIGSSRGEIALFAQPLGAALAVERDLTLAGEVLRAVHDAQTQRSQDARLLEVLTGALPDSTYLLSVRRGHDGRVHLVGLAPSAAGVVATLGAVPGVAGASLEGGVMREMGRGRPRERFTVAFSWRPEGGR